MKTSIVLFFLLAFSVCVHSDEVNSVDGGDSPNKKLAVVIVWKGTPHSPPSEADEATAYLINKQTGKLIGPLEEVDLEGGDEGKGKGEAGAFWNKDGRLLAMNSFDGFSANFETIYSIEQNRAIPQEIESPWDSPLIKGVITPRGHSRQYFSKWLDSTHFDICMDNFLPSGGYAHYRKVGSKWRVVGFTSDTSL